MNRREFVSGVVLALLAAPLAAEAQQAGKVPHVGLLGLDSAEVSPLFEALRQGLREGGWVEGQNIVFEDRTTVGDYGRLPDVAAELVRLKVDVIVTWGTTTALAARKATWTIPIVTIVDRRTFVGTLTIGLLAAPLVAGAEQVFRIGILGNVPLTDPEGSRNWGAFTIATFHDARVGYGP